MTESRISRIETVRHDAERELLHVLVTDDAGHVGTGETHGHPSAVDALIGELAPALDGLPATPAAVAEISGAGPYGGPRGSGHVSVESRAASALDLALHDLAGHRAGLPLHALLGGLSDATVTAYSTCMDADHEATLRDPAGLAAAVAAGGFGMLKVWPFVPGGDHDAAAAAVAATCGHGVAVAVDLYGVLADDEAAHVCRLLDPLGLAWIEDPVADGRYGRLAELSASLSTPLCAGERLAGAGAYPPLLATGVAVVHLDVAWCGGVDEARRIAALAAGAGRRLALHDVSGPIAWATSLHLARAVAPATYVECSRLAVRDRYPAIVEGLPAAAGAVPPPGCGHGLRLRPAWLAGARRRVLVA